MRSSRFAIYSTSLLAVAILYSGFVSCAVYAAPSRTFNVHTYGATGNGTTDDSAAIQAAFTAASSFPGSTVDFPPGNYLYSKALNGTSISLSASRSATLTASVAAASIQLSGNNVRVTGFNLVDESAAATAVTLANVTGYTFSNNAFSNFAQGVSINNSDSGQIESNSFLNISTALGINNAKSMSIQKNTFTNNNSTVYRAIAVSANNSNSITASSNSFTGMRGGVISNENCSSCTVSSNSFKNVALPVSFSYGSAVTVSSNTSTQPSTFGTLSYCTQVVIETNKISNGSSAIQLEYNTNVQVLKNTMSSMSQYGVQTGRNTNLTISHNTFSSVIKPIGGGGNTTVSIASNTLQSCQTAISLSLDSNESISGNNLNTCDTGIDSSSANNVSITKNTIANTQWGNALTVTGATGSVVVSGNTLSNDAVVANYGVAAVIYCDNPGAASQVISNNSYSGNTARLVYFIDVTQANATVTGNKTSTTLPNKIGI